MGNKITKRVKGKELQKGEIPYLSFGFFQEALDLFNYLTDNGILSRDSRSSIVYNLCLEGERGGEQKLEPRNDRTGYTG